MFSKPARALAALAAAGITVAAAPASGADAWPTRTIRYIVPFSPGGVSDGVARLMAEQLTKRLGQSVIVENRPGVSGIVGPADFVAFQRSEIEKWGKVIKDAGIQAD